MVNRGIVNSTTTTSQLASLLGQAAPEFEQAAYARWSNEQQRAMQRAQFLAGLDQTAFAQDQALQDNAFQLSSYLGQLNDDDYATYKSSLTATQAQRAADLKAVQDYYAAQKSALDSTVARVNQLGYVDNEAALVLGISVGTPAAQVNTAITNKQRELQNLESRSRTLRRRISVNRKWRIRRCSYGGVQEPGCTPTGIVAGIG